MMGMGMKRMVKFLMDKQPEDVIPHLAQIREERKGRRQTCVCRRHLNKHKGKETQ